MDLTQLANLGEFIGGIAVLVTLIYLALQVNQNTRTLRASSTQAINDSTSGFLTAIALDGEATDIFRRGLIGESDLDANQTTRFFLLMHAAFRRYESAYLQYRMGALDASNWQSWQATVAGALAESGARAWWERASALYSEDFRSFVAVLVSEEGRSDGSKVSSVIGSR